MLSHSLRTLILSTAVVGLGLSIFACQKIDRPKTTLTQKQWEKVKSHIKDDEPDVDYPVGANYDGKIELVGFDVSKPLKAGESTEFTWYWKALEDLDDNWKVFVHFDSSEESYRQNLDHHPMEGLYRTGRWKEDQIIEDVQKVDLDADFPEGQAVPYVGFFRGDKRLPIENDVKKTDDRRVIGPTLNVKGKSASADDKPDPSDLPSHTASRIDSDEAEAIEVDGKLDEEVWEEADALELDALGSAKPRDTEVELAYDSKHLYVGAHLEDEHIWSEHDERDANTWEEEVFEIFIDPDGRDAQDYLELQINPLGTVFDAHFDEQLGRGEGSRDEQIDRARSWNMEGLESAVHVEGTVNDDSDEDEFWSVEMRLPFDQMPPIDNPPNSKDEWAVNFYRYDRPDDETTHTYAWSPPTSGSFHQVERFGSVVFGSGSDDDSESPKTTSKDQERLKQMHKELENVDQRTLKGLKPRPKAPSQGVE